MSALDLDLHADLATSDWDDDLWHVAADDVQEWRSRHGLSWRTLCGLMADPDPDPDSAPDWDDREPDDCAMCRFMDDEVAS